jgi:hypothetical protein
MFDLFGAMLITIGNRALGLMMPSGFLSATARMFSSESQFHPDLHLPPNLKAAIFNFGLIKFERRVYSHSESQMRFD